MMIVVFLVVGLMFWWKVLKSLWLMLLLLFDRLVIVGVWVDRLMFNMLMVLLVVFSCIILLFCSNDSGLLWVVFGLMWMVVGILFDVFDMWLLVIKVMCKL